MNGGPQARLQPGTVHPKHLLHHSTSVVTTTSTRVSTSGTIPSLEEEEAAPNTVLCAATGNRSLSGLTAVDGITIEAGDPVALAFQTNPIENGFYLASAGTWTRAGTQTIVPGATWEILQGTVYGNRQLVCTNDANPLVGTDAIAFAVRPGGTGTANRITKWTGAATVGDSQIFDSGLYVSIPAEDASALGRLEVYDDTDDRSTGYFHKGHAATAFHAIEAASTSADSNGYTAWITNIGGGPGMFVQAASSGNGIDINVDGGYGVSSIPIGDGIAFNANRDVASVSNPLVRFKEEHVSASATTLEVVSDGSGVVGYFKSDSDAGSNPILDVLQDAPGGSVVRPAARIVNRAAHTSAHGVSVSADSGNAVHALSTSTGRAGYFHRNTSVGSLAVVYVHQDHSSNSAAALQIDNDGTGHGILINAINGGDAINAYSLAGGRAALFSRDQAGATSAVVEIVQDNAAGAQIALALRNDSVNAGHGLSIVVASDGDGIGCAVVGGQKEAGYFYRPATTTGTGPTVQIWQDSTTDTQAVLHILSDGTGNPITVDDGGAGNIFAVEDGGCVNTRGSGVRHSTRTVSAATTLAKNDHILFCQTSTAAAGFAVTLPAPAAGLEFILIDSQNNAATKNVTLTRNGAESIDGAGANKVLNTNNFRLIVWSDGTNWFTK